MRAAQFERAGSPLRLVTVPTPEPGPGEALVAVRSVGLCGSDLHITQGHTPTAYAPITVGHEIAGVVAALGPGVTGPLVGEHVFVNPMIGCGRCLRCGDDDPASCADRRTLGIHLPGGLADYLVAPAGNLTVVPDRLSFGEVALVESAGTANRAVRLLDVGEADVVLVIGVGGLGLQAVRLARGRGATVITADLDPVARRRSVEAGAAVSFDSAETDLEAKITAEAGRIGVTRVVDCVGAPSTVELAFQVLAPAGHVALIGIGDTPVTIASPAMFVRRGQRLSAVYGYSNTDIADVIDRLVEGSLDLAASISETYPLQCVNEAIAIFANRTNSPTRVVITL
ncbi:zinc-binding dehydrogenase [Streptomyces bobili]|uniref:zinc-dependent alcohol dehydrogenase n=1 Tax=Streptomyces bobili TaxID=67280 RepID=UPI003649823E